ncbi:MAG: 50S ribosomal protein L23 [Cyclobacteriaceae bacterium]|jgi:large subunit ribosomal protein L23|nr:50S ribosomal protein L23 [Cyclobacteriaceae bacterium]
MSVLKKPLVTEKVSAMNESGKYGFVVDKSANKVEIKKAIEKAYGVTVESVNTMIYAGKSKSKYSKSRVIAGKSAAYKKAIIQVADGEIIDFYGAV